MKMQDALHSSLDELRMQMLGVQVMFGFQFNAVFEDNFAAVGVTGRRLDGLGMGCLVVAMGLMIAVTSQHRVVDRGLSTPRVHRVAMQYASLALLFLALGLGCNTFVATDAPFGKTWATVLGTGAFLLAFGAWFVLAFALRRRWRPRNAAHAVMDGDMTQTTTPLHIKIEQQLTEARVILPGAQALLGFQFIVMLTQTFRQLPGEIRIAHLIALISLTSAIVLLICPATVHRITFSGHDDPRLYDIGARLLAMALVPLAAGISLDVWTAFVLLNGENGVAYLAGAGAFTLLIALWFVGPLILKQQLARRSQGH
jgi:hypothetical protein